MSIEVWSESLQFSSTFMIKNHPFQNGNKRIALTALLTFLYLNDKWLHVSIDELYQFSVWIASSPAMAKDETVIAIESFLKRHLTKA